MQPNETRRVRRHLGGVDCQRLSHRGQHSQQGRQDDNCGAGEDGYSGRRGAGEHQYDNRLADQPDVCIRTMGDRKVGERNHHVYCDEKSPQSCPVPDPAQQRGGRDDNVGRDTNDSQARPHGRAVAE